MIFPTFTGEPVIFWIPIPLVKVLSLLAGTWIFLSKSEVTSLKLPKDYVMPSKLSFEEVVESTSSAICF